MRPLYKALLLAGVPLVLMTGIGVALILQGKPTDGRSVIAVGVIIAATSAASLIYQIDRWSLPKQTIVHFVIMLVTVLPAIFVSGWIPLTSAWGYVAVVGMFLGFGAVLWSVFFVVFGKLVPRAVAAKQSRRSAPARDDASQDPVIFTRTAERSGEIEP